jgi:hypothetical protein
MPSMVMRESCAAADTHMQRCRHNVVKIVGYTVGRHMHTDMHRDICSQAAVWT